MKTGRGGSWIKLADKLITNNLSMTQEDMGVWKEILKRLWEINQERIRILKGAKYYELERTGEAKFVSFKDGIPQDDRVEVAEIYEAEQKARNLKLALEYFVKCVSQDVPISKVISLVDDRFEINLSLLET